MEKQFLSYYKTSASTEAATTQKETTSTYTNQHYTPILELSARLCEVPLALIALDGEEELWTFSKSYTSITQQADVQAFCREVLDTKQVEKVHVRQKKQPTRYTDSASEVMFYAGVPIPKAQQGFYGVLCVLDYSTKTLSDAQNISLKQLAQELGQRFDAHTRLAYAQQKNIQLRKQYKEMEQFAYMLSHDIRSPLGNMSSLIELLQEEAAEKLSTESQALVNYLGNAVDKLSALTQNIIHFYKQTQIDASTFECINLTTLIEGILLLVAKHEETRFQFEYPTENLEIYTHRQALEHIFMNLITNAIKYNDKPQGYVKISFHEGPQMYHFTVTDNGQGIAKENQTAIFDAFTHLGKQDRYQKIGSGIGLAIVHQFVKKLQGKVFVESEVGKGSAFHFSIQKVHCVDC